jgi:membrane-bound serine protease (ClpP class)
VLLTIDTPGGLDSSMRRIVKAILASSVPVICYTAPAGARAASAGTFVMMACPYNAMAPGTNIGAAHPVGVSGVIEQAKVTNDAAAFIRSLAQRWSRNADWAEQAVRQSVSASADEALRLHAVDLVAPDRRALLDRIGGCGAGSGETGSRPPVPGLCGTRLAPVGMSATEALFHSFGDPNVAFLLVNLGTIALVVWLIHPAFHIALPIGVVLLVLGLLVLETLPVRLAGLELLLAAAILFVIDVRARAHGLLTAAGLAAFVTGGLLLFNPAVPSARVSRALLAGLAVVIAGFMLVVVRAMVTARHRPLLARPGQLAGTSGVATTALDPDGTVRASGEAWSAVSVAGPIPAGTPVRIVSVKGLTLEVEPQPAPSGRKR